MPLIRIDAVAGRSPDQVKDLLDAAHRAMLTAFKVPERDRYQVYEEHAANHFIVQDTGLGIPRTKNVIVVIRHQPSAHRGDEEDVLRGALPRAERMLWHRASDVMVSIVTNTDADWSFGNGRAQFLTGEL